MDKWGTEAHPNDNQMGQKNPARPGQSRKLPTSDEINLEHKIWRMGNGTDDNPNTHRVEWKKSGPA
jgi:hypothetical protein